MRMMKCRAFFEGEDGRRMHEEFDLGDNLTVNEFLATMGDNVVFFCGFHDKNGRDVFEKDVYRFEHYNVPPGSPREYTYAIAELRGNQFNLWDLKWASTGMLDTMLRDIGNGNAWRWEYLGNALERPELLKLPTVAA